MNREEVIKSIVAHIQGEPKEHETPDHLRNTYSGMGSPFMRCKKCRKLVKANGITREELGKAGVRVGMYHTYIENGEQSGGVLLGSDTND